MKLLQKNDLKSYLLFSSKSLLRIIRFTPKVHFLPSLIIYPSNKCNFRCIMCESGTDNVTTARRMEFTTLEGIIKECSTYRIKPKVHFSGLGEPLVYPEIVNVMKLCKQRHIAWSMTSNGYLLDRYAEEIVANDCRAINISIHGNEAEHNRVTGVNNSFNQVIKGLRKLENLKRTTDNRIPLVAINCVITNQNVANLKDILDNFLNLPVSSITFQHLVFSTDDMLNKKPFVLHQEQSLASLQQFIAYVNRNKFPLKINFFPRIKIEDIPEYYSAGNDKFNQSCIFPWLSARIYPNGDVGMCNNVFGNILRSSLKSIINSENAVSFRKSLIENNFRSPACFRCCHRHYY